MKYTITGKKLDINDELRRYTEKKVGKIERLFRKGESEAFITFSLERGRYTAEVTLSNNGMFYRVSETTGDIFASVDSACASIERQIRKNKTRLEKKLKAGPIDWADYGAAPEPEEEEGEEFNIVRTKRFSMKPMTPQEAILQMNLLEHTFYAFLNSEDGDAFSVVYRRKNGGYGLISDAAE